MAYLSWMMAQGFTAAQITQAGGSVLAANYAALTGKTTAWVDLQAGLAAIQVAIKNDDPFGGVGGGRGFLFPPPPPPPPPAAEKHPPTPTPPHLPFPPSLF